MVEKYGEDVSKHPKVDSEVWIKMGGENKKGRIHGIGRSLELAIINVNGSSSSVVGPSTNPNHASPTEEITAIATQMSQMQQQMQTQLDLQTESQKQLQIELQAQIEAHAQQVQAQLKAQADMHAQFQAQFQAQIQAQMQAQVEMQKLLQQQMHTQMQTQMEFFKTQIFPTLKISSPPSVKKHGENKI
ncbi:probable basic-leucine zipper transcription factor P [Vigna unguiculata]|uniref:probable basic-leucine zipper transcription factor P n=1 Tax=Vigna unguiculata TaxID=3917 RepID=UPI001016A595|nr:probable basic-leucine zipper transcription factor P [Vigna unguiculata]